MTELEKENALFQAALKYKESLIYIHLHTKIYKILYENKSFYFKINTKENTFSFSNDFFSLVMPENKLQNLSAEDITCEDYKLNKEKTISFYSLKNKEEYYNQSLVEFYPLLDLIFSAPTNGRPRKYFKNSFGKVLISNKKQKLTGHYKMIDDPQF